VEFPVRVKGLFRPHYVTWSEQQTIEAHAPEYLRNIVRIITETGLRVYRELMPLKKEQLDLTNAMVWISGFEDSERSGRSAADAAGARSVPRSDAALTLQSVSVSER
jgi:integrase